MAEKDELVKCPDCGEMSYDVENQFCDRDACDSNNIETDDDDYDDDVEGDEDEA